MTLPRMPDNVKAAIERYDQEMLTYNARDPNNPMPMDIVKVDGGDNDLVRIWSHNQETGQYVLSLENTRGWFQSYDQTISTAVEQRYNDVELINKWTRGGSYTPYTANWKEITAFPKERSKKERRGMAGRGSTVLTGGLGVYSEPETQKQKLGS